MAQSHPFKALLLAGVTAFCVAGCGAVPEASNSRPSTAGSCAVQSAEARPPKHPIVELAACIARTDDLLDPDRLFHETLGIKDYGGLGVTSWGIQAGVGRRSDRNSLEHLPSGVDGFLFQRVDVEKFTVGGKRYLTVSLAPSRSCVTLADVVATFGNGYAISPHPVVAPAPALPGVISFPPAKAGKFPGVYYSAQRLFNGPVNGAVHFDFDYDECAHSIYVQRDLRTTDRPAKGEPR